MTAAELLLEIAERAHLADHTNPDDENDNRARLPEDPHDLDVLWRALRTGYGLFLRSNPNWQFVRRVVSLTFDLDGTGPANVAGDPARYRLPEYVSGPPEDAWTYGDDNSDVLCIQPVSDAELRALQAASVQTGTPAFVSHRPFTPDDAGVAGRTAWEAVFYPAPGIAHTLSATFRIQAGHLVDLADRHVAGPDHDETIICAAVFHLARNDKIPGLDRDTAEADWLKALADSRTLEAAKAPPTVGPLRKTGQPAAESRYRGRGHTFSYNGTPIP